MFVTWEDSRIKATFASVDNGDIGLPPVRKNTPSLIWNPFQDDQYFIHGLKERKYISEPTRVSSVRLFASHTSKSKAFAPNITLAGGMIEWKITVSCPFEFSQFPFDNHTCQFKMKWYSVNPIFSEGAKFQNRWKQKDNNGFTFSKRLLKTIQGKNGRGKPYSTFGFKIKMKRVIQPYVYQYYLPCMSMVLVSFISFLVPLSALPGRIALVVTQCLTLTNIFIHQRVDITINSILQLRSLISYFTKVTIIIFK
jgi:hypothetical protein